MSNCRFFTGLFKCREVVVTQLAERSLTIPEDPDSNPHIGNFY